MDPHVEQRRYELMDGEMNGRRDEWRTGEKQTGMINGQKMNAVVFHLQRLTVKPFKMTTKSFQRYGSMLRHMDRCNSSMVMSQGGLLHRLRDFIVANVRWFSGLLQRGQDGRAVCRKCQ